MSISGDYDRRCPKNVITGGHAVSSNIDGVALPDHSGIQLSARCILCSQEVRTKMAYIDSSHFTSWAALDWRAAEYVIEEEPV